MKGIIRRLLHGFGIGIVMLTVWGCGMVRTSAVKAGLAESPYYHLGDTWWDHGGIEEYYFNQIPSELNEIYRELYERIKNYEDSADLYASVSTIRSFFGLTAASRQKNPPLPEK